jgi:hypothetical protein
MAELGDEAFLPAVFEVETSGEAFFELDVTAFLFAVCEGLLQGGPIRAHSDSLARGDKNAFRAMTT